MSERRATHSEGIKIAAIYPPLIGRGYGAVSVSCVQNPYYLIQKGRYVGRYVGTYLSLDHRRLFPFQG